MDDRIGRAADRQQHAQRVLDRLGVDDPIGRELRADQPDRRSAGGLRRAQPVRVHGRDRGGARQHHAERLGDAGHGARRCPSPRRCRPSTASRPSTSSISSVVDLAGAVLRPEAAAIGAGAEPLAAMAAGHHRPRHQHDRRAGRPRPRPSAAPARSCRSRPSARPRPSAARGSSPRCPSTSGCGISGWSGRERPRPARWSGNSIGSAPAARTPRLTASSSSGKWRWQLLKSGRRIGDADDRLGQHRARIAHRLRERAAQIEREIAVAVIGQAVGEAHRAFGHRSGSSAPGQAHSF